MQTNFASCLRWFNSVRLGDILPGIDELTGEGQEDEGNLLRGVAGHKVR